MFKEVGIKQEKYTKDLKEKKSPKQLVSQPFQGLRSQFLYKRVLPKF